MSGNNNRPPDEAGTHKPYQIFLVYLDGALFAATEALTADEVKETFSKAYQLRAGRLQAVLAAVAPIEDIERLEKVFGLRAQIFNIRQMQMVLKAQAGGLAIPSAGDLMNLGPPPGANGPRRM